MHSPHGGCIFCLSKNGGLFSASGMSGRSIAATHRSEIWFAVELVVEFAAFFDVSLDYLLVGKGDFAEEQKRGLRMAISLLSEWEASL